MWLGQVPDHTVLFARLALVLTLAEIISNALITAQGATGKIKNYQIVVGGILLLNFPISYVLLKMGVFPEVTLVVAIVISQICLVARLWFLRSMIKLPVREFIRRVYLNVLVVTFMAVVLPALCYFFMEPSWLRLFVLGIVSIVSSACSIYYIGCGVEERVMVKVYMQKFMQRIFHR